jgi:predicted transcriptional regulator
MRERRENSFISLRALSDVVDMSEHALRNIELGDSDPKLSNVLKIAGALQIDMGMLNSCIPVLIEI